MFPSLLKQKEKKHETKISHTMKNKKLEIQSTVHFKLDGNFIDCDFLCAANSLSGQHEMNQKSKSEVMRNQVRAMTKVRNQ